MITPKPAPGCFKFQGDIWISNQFQYSGILHLISLQLNNILSLKFLKKSTWIEVLCFTPYVKVLQCICFDNNEVTIKTNFGDVFISLDWKILQNIHSTKKIIHCKWKLTKLNWIFLTVKIFAFNGCAKIFFFQIHFLVKFPKLLT